MKIPDKILKKLEAAEKKKREHEESKKKAEHAKKEKQERIEEYRQKKMGDLRRAAEKIQDWIIEFCSSSEGKRILKVSHIVNLYVGHFWLGEPQPGKIFAVWAVLCLENGKWLYREKHKGMTSREIVVGNCKRIIENLHPDFVLQAAKAIEDGSVWKYVEMSVPKYAY